MRIGVYIGSFNPVHKGHIEVINYLLDNNYIDKVMVIPTGNYWDKDNLLDTSKRIGMLKLYENDNIIINDKLNNISYTYLLLRELKKEIADELYLIIGADNIIKFDLWKEYKEIINNYKILVLPRDKVDIFEYLNKFDNKDNFIVVNDFKEMDIASSEIRNLLIHKEYDKVSKYLDNIVVDYIKKNGLYV